MSTIIDSRNALQAAPIALERPLHFATAGGGHVEMHPGSYHVDIDATGHLELTPFESLHDAGKALHTVTTWHPFTLDAPVGVTVPADHGQHIVLLLPNGSALQATGSPRRDDGRARHAFVTPRALAEALLDWTPSPRWPTVKLPFNRLTVLLTFGGFAPAWGTIEPGTQPTPFIDPTLAPTWIDAVVAECKTAPGATMIAPGTHENRRTLRDQLVSLVPVTVKSMVSWAGKTIELLVTSQVVSPGGYARYMTWTDTYSMVASSNAPYTFQNVIAASALVYHALPYVKKTAGEEAAYILTSPSGRGAPTTFELRVNGVRQAYKACEYLGHFPGGTPELRST